MVKCPICFKKANYITHCKHHFCKKCLYHWDDACPLCRSFITLDYPNTRAMSKQTYVIDNIRILLSTIKRIQKPKYKILYSGKMLQFLWDHRIVIRKYYKLCKIIRERSAYIKEQCILLKITPPNIISKTLTI